MPRAYVKGLSITQEIRERYADRFLGKVLKTETCWIWEGKKHPSGYGYFYLPSTSKKSIGAHRVSWLLFKGDQPPGMVVRHKCDNPSCVNPAHLELGTQLDNVADAFERGRYAHKTKRDMCSRGLHKMEGRNVITEHISRVGVQKVRRCRACKYAADKARKAGKKMDDGRKAGQKDWPRKKGKGVSVANSQRGVPATLRASVPKENEK